MDNTVSQVEETTEENPQKKTEQVIDTEKVERLTKEVESFQSEVKNKVYPVKVESEVLLGELIDFIENKADWKDMEALGIIEVSKALNNQIGKVTGGNIFLKNLEIEAISFFLRKVSNKGIKEAEKHIQKVRPINDALRLLKLDNDKLMNMQNQLAAAENGLELDPGKTEE